MKKNIISLLLIPVIVLSGCSKNNSSKNSNKEVKNSTVQFIAENADYYKNGVIFGRDKAMFLDFDTMEKAPLCAMPNCNHTTSDCLAQIVGNKPIFYNNCVYFFYSNYGDVNETTNGYEFYIDSKLMKASLDSSETETVCEFHDCSPVEKVGNYVLYDNEIFFVGDDRNPTKDDYGGIGWGSSGGYHFLCSINLDTGKYTNYGSIYDGDKEYEGADYSSDANIIGIYDNKMYIRYSFCKDNEALQSGIIDYTDISFEFDFKSKTWKEAELPYTPYMNEDCYIYYDRESKNVKVIYQGKESEINPGIDSLMDFRLSQCSEFNGKVFFPGVGKWYDLSDSSEHSMGKYVKYEVIGYKDGSYIFLKGGATAKLTEEELLALDKEE